MAEGCSSLTIVRLLMNFTWQTSYYFPLFLRAVKGKADLTVYNAAVIVSHCSNLISTIGIWFDLFLPSIFMLLYVACGHGTLTRTRHTLICLNCETQLTQEAKCKWHAHEWGTARQAQEKVIIVRKCWLSFCQLVFTPYQLQKQSLLSLFLRVLSETRIPLIPFGISAIKKKCPQNSGLW